MKSRRTAKVAQAILETVSSTILFGLKDPRVRHVTVLHVDVSPDIRNAKVYVSIMGSEKETSLCMHGLNSARGFLQSKCADRLQTRNTPVLTFVLDDSVKKSLEAAQILKSVLPDAADGDSTGEAEIQSQQPDGGSSDDADDDDAPAGGRSPADAAAESN